MSQNSVRLSGSQKYTLVLILSLSVLPSCAALQVMFPGQFCAKGIRDYADVERTIELCQINIYKAQLLNSDDVSNHMQLAEAYGLKGDFPAAERELKQVLDFYARNPSRSPMGLDTLNSYVARWQLAEVYVNWGRDKKDSSQFHKAFKLVEAGKGLLEDSLNEGVRVAIVHRLAGVFLEEGHPEKTSDLLTAIEKMYPPKKGQEDRASALAIYHMILRSKLLRHRTPSQKEVPAEKEQEADDMLEAAVNLGSKKHPDSAEYLLALTMLAERSSEKGDFRYADELWERASAENLREATFGGLVRHSFQNSVEHLDLRNVLASWQLQNGRFDDARSSLNSVSTILRYRYDSKQSIEHLRHLSRWLELALEEHRVGMNRSLQDATKRCAEMAPIRKALSTRKDPAQRFVVESARSLALCGDVDHANNNRTEALKKYQDALAQLQRFVGSQSERPDSEQAHILLRQGGVLLELAELQRAEQSIKESLALRRSTPTHLDVAHAHRLLARLALLRNAPLLACTELREALTVEERHLRAFASASRVQHQRGRGPNETEQLAYRIALAYPTLPQARDLAMTVVLLRKGRAMETGQYASELLRRAASSGAAKESFQEYNALVAEHSQLVRNGNPIDPKLADSERKVLAKYESLLRKLPQGSLELPSVSKILPDVRSVLKGKHKGSTLIEFVEIEAAPAPLPQTETIYAAFLLLDQGDVRVVRLGARKPIDDVIVKLVSRFEAEGKGVGKEQYEPFARELHRLVMAPVLAQTSSEKLFLSPTLGLLNAPFAAALHKGKYLIEDHRLVYLASGRDLSRKAVNRPSDDLVIIAIKESETKGQAVAKPQHVVKDTAKNPLPESEKEGSLLKGMFPHALLLRDQEANEPAVVSAIRHPRLLHITAHGFYDTPDKTPVRQTTKGKTNKNISGGFDEISMPFGWNQRNAMDHAGIVLGKVNLAPDRSDRDGVLTATEFAGLDLRGTELVNFSTCQSAQGSVVPGEGLAGFRRAAVDAGAQATLATGWKVNEMASCAFMDALYRRLAGGKTDPSIALQETMKLFLHQKWPSPSKAPIDLSKPAHWAAMFYTGTDRPINLPPIDSVNSPCGIKLQPVPQKNATAK
ncbi:MAG TPA: CHAT domain-containing protein [Pseudomonadota bacterium]|nr:CHAT domain-containing protein [Pseudomonadota bacterium]